MSISESARGLDMEENLLYEKSATGACGVDLPEPKNIPSAYRLCRTCRSWPSRGK